MRHFVLILFTLLAGADETASLKDLLDGYSREMSERGSSDTIPVEQAILRARDAGDFALLAEFADHERFGSEILWALGEARKEEARALAAFRKLPLPGRVEAALPVGAYRSDGARKALIELLADPGLDGPSKSRVEAALLRAGEPKALAATKAALRGKDPEGVADALLLLGDARASEFLEEALRRASDATKLAEERRSIFEAMVTTTAEDGTVTRTSGRPVLATLGDAAVEAASRMVKSTTPERMAWWCDVERGPRFPCGSDGAKLLKQWVEQDRKARNAKAVGAEAALLALMRSLRERTPEGPIELSLLSIAFDKGWTLRYRAGDGEATATVDPSGKLSG